MAEEKIAIIRIRGIIGINEDIRRTLRMFNIHRKHYCSIVPKTDAYLGMAKKVKDFTTFGIIDAETEKLLIEKRGEEGKKFFRLCPPKGGFERKGIKTPFALGGALGNRKDKINDLIRRMI